jgi:hypothetical protein
LLLLILISAAIIIGLLAAYPIFALFPDNFHAYFFIASKIFCVTKRGSVAWNVLLNEQAVEYQSENRQMLNRIQYCRS